APLGERHELLHHTVISGHKGGKIGTPLGRRQPERLARDARGELGNPPGIERPPLTVERVHADQTLDPPRDHGYAFPRRLPAPQHLGGKPPPPGQAREAAQRAPALRQRPSGVIAQSPSQPPGGARAPVDRSRATEPHDYRLGAAIDRFPNELAYATRGCMEGVELIWPQQRDPAGSRGFEHRRVTVQPPQPAAT